MSPAQTAAEATKRMLDSKRLSNKINYEVLDNLFNTDSVTQGWATIFPCLCNTVNVHTTLGHEESMTHCAGSQ